MTQLPFRVDPSNIAQLQLMFKRIINSCLNPVDCLVETKRNPLKFGQMIAVFSQLAVGCGIALLIVAVEYGVQFWRKRKSKNFAVEKTKYGVAEPPKIPYFLNNS